MNIFFIAASIVFAVAVLFLSLGYLSFLRACKKRGDGRKKINFSCCGSKENEMRKALEEYERLGKEEISICSHDGLKLYASYIPAKEPNNKFIIAFHGYRSSDTAEFSHICPRLMEKGYSFIMIDQRAHGRSEGKYVGFGVLERFDCKSWCEYITERFGNHIEIYLYGMSMGASTVLMAASLELPDTVRAVVADCGFTSPWEIIKNTLRYKKKIPPYPLIYFMNYWSRQLAGFDFREISTPESAQKSSLPTLYIHGQKDKYVPAYMSERAFEKANDHCRLVLFENAKHEGSYLSDTDRYFNEMTDFLEQH